METGIQEELVHALREVVLNSNWQCVGEKESFKTTCTKFYSEDGENVVLIRTDHGNFYAMDSSCPHEGGPLELGDIEELGNGRLALSCPWHDFEFSLHDGTSSSGLQNQVYEVKVCEDRVYVRTQRSLSRIPSKDTGIELCGAISSKESSQCTSMENTLSFWATKILCTPDPDEKAHLTHKVQEMWNTGQISAIGQEEPPAQPSRKDNLQITEPGRIKRGKGGTLASRFALLHSLANIEQCALDLSWDIIVRFAAVKLPGGDCLPREFFNDFVKVAGDEAKHYKMLQKRLTELGGDFGTLPVHNGLWQSATDTSHSLLARLAIIHMVHEARGLDVHPLTLNRFAAQGDQASVKVLEVIYADEITHVAAGMKWFTHICAREERDCLSTFHELVPLFFKGYLKPPFNTKGRKTAGMTEEWYLPLVKSAH